ncbi:MAG: hypothetical protein AB2604_10740 [Candidatus Thiodiazotropha taylori]
MTELSDIEQKAKAYSLARDVLKERLIQLDVEKRQLIKKHLKALRAAATKVADTHSALHSEIDMEHALFKKPRSRVYWGIKVGLRKSQGTLRFAPDVTIPAIKKKLPDKKDVLIETKEKVVNKAVNTLSAPELKKIGVTVLPGKDQVVIQPIGDEINKLIDAWLADLSDFEVKL